MTMLTITLALALTPLVPEPPPADDRRAIVTATLEFVARREKKGPAPSRSCVSTAYAGMTFPGNGTARPPRWEDRPRSREYRPAPVAAPLSDGDLQALAKAYDELNYQADLRAWTSLIGRRAPEAAGAVPSDIVKAYGFGMGEPDAGDQGCGDRLYHLNLPAVHGLTAFIGVGMACERQCGGWATYALMRRGARWQVVAMTVHAVA